MGTITTFCCNARAHLSPRSASSTDYTQRFNKPTSASAACRAIQRIWSRRFALLSSPERLAQPRARGPRGPAGEWPWSFSSHSRMCDAPRWLEVAWTLHLAQDLRPPAKVRSSPRRDQSPGALSGLPVSFPGHRIFLSSIRARWKPIQSPTRFLKPALPAARAEQLIAATATAFGVAHQN